MRYDFDWDPRKANENLRKHHISFERATTVFRDPRMISLFDEEHNETEDRWVTMGRDESLILLVISHTFREVSSTCWKIRIISARKATAKERRQYEENA
ncbi:hypothetical protein U14_01165 [Candidatus Moduliflexus flocculans]|uniref:BrnT family toxin n=1 Tax=Candidatus Moduliflexus flocculans TaxID=1499966 RepID=A0A0S6VRL2_9BACT|nr:hypothetical protein U14_01165 [Candidatus Moduliflexus flocculans]